MDSVIFGPFHFSAYFAWSTLLTGGSWDEAWTKIKDNFITTYLLELLIWPPVQCVNFLHVPVRHQLAFVNAFCVVDSGLLSHISHSPNFVRNMLGDKVAKKVVRKSTEIDRNNRTFN